MTAIYVWDPIKAEKNQRKHGLSFSTARKVFEDDTQLDLYQGDEDGEPRWLTVGAVGEQVIAVVYTWQEDEEDDIVRIISARLASQSETRRYQGTR